jgi:hypothetical protein
VDIEGSSLTETASRGVARARDLITRDPDDIFIGARNPAGTAQIEAGAFEEGAAALRGLRSRFEPSGEFVGARNPLGRPDLYGQAYGAGQAAGTRLRGLAEGLRPDAAVQGARNPLGLPMATTLGQEPLYSRAIRALEADGPTDLGRPLPTDLGERGLTERAASLGFGAGVTTLQGARNPLGPAALGERFASELTGGASAIRNRLLVVQGRTDLGRPLPTDLGELGLSQATLRLRGGRPRRYMSELETGSFIEGEVDADAMDLDLGRLETEAEADATPELDVDTDTSTGQTVVARVRPQAETATDTEAGTQDMVRSAWLRGLRRTEPRLPTEGVGTGPIEGGLGPLDRLAPVSAQPQTQRPGQRELPMEPERQVPGELLVQELEAGQEPVLRPRAELEQEGVQEPALRSDLELELRRRRELELAREIEGEFEFEFEPSGRPERGQPSREGGRAVTGGRTRPADSVLAPGWLAQSVAAFAGLGGSAREAPSQAALQEASYVERISGNLPIAAQVSGTESEQEALEEAQRLLSFDDGYTDDWEWFA